MPRTPELHFRSVPSPREIEWIRILERWKQSGLGGRAFCQREGLSEPQFYCWKRKIRLRQDAQAPARRPQQTRRRLRFVPVEVKPASGAPLELALAGGRVVRIPSDFDSAALARLLAVLEDRSSFAKATEDKPC